MINALYMFLIIVILIIFILIRQYWGFCCHLKVSELVSDYTDYLIDNGKYNNNINYFEEMEIETYKFVFKFWYWNYKKLIKPQYKELLEEFKGYRTKKKEERNKII